MTNQEHGLPADPADPRSAQLAARLAEVDRRIADATTAAGRSSKPNLIVVTKFHPAADVVRLAALGVRDVGENRDQEAAAKAAEVGDPRVRWHFIGQLQSNKAKSVVKYASSVQSVDRTQLVDALGKAVARHMDTSARAELDCFIQVSLEDDAGASASFVAPSVDDAPEHPVRANSNAAEAAAAVSAVARNMGNPSGGRVARNRPPPGHRGRGAGGIVSSVVIFRTIGRTSPTGRRWAVSAPAHTIET